MRPLNKSSSRKKFGRRKKKGKGKAYKAICGKCGKDFLIGFKPKEDKPVLCGGCYRPKRANHR
ncbi:MAG: hypothetical protein ISS36_01250 [Candidatus Aenigmarchaeota archaeon]|nr:hypothetical protein [Candidatus Aenigmarchaeota archaeon]